MLLFKEKMNKSSFFTLLFICFFTTLLSAQSQSPCSTDAHRQFDFWVGEWDVYHTTADTVVGASVIKSILNDCVIEENWTGSTGFIGKSFNTYNSVDSTWNQIWVDGSGASYRFSGKYEKELMDLKGVAITKKGKNLFSLTFQPDKEADTVRQVWKVSTDNGAKWQTLFDGTYRRKKE